MSILFTYDLICCPCGCRFYRYDHELVHRLTQAHYLSSDPFQITSWCRCMDYNTQVGGAVNSGHLLGEAVEIYCPNGLKWFERVEALMQAGFKRIILYDDCIYTDVSKTKTSPYLTYMEG